MKNPITFALIHLIRLYRYLLSPLWPGSCRFHPTCSAYAIEALSRHGVLKGLCLATSRILRCHPYSKRKGIDPVPETIDWHEMIGYKSLGKKPDIGQNDQ